MSHQAQRGEGVECLGDTECGTGLMCEMGYCIPFTGKKHYNEPCTTSSECDVSRGLCCQLVRRYRQEPKTLCGYFKDPMICFGHVAEDQVKHVVQHTKGEKRLMGWGHDNYYY
ncbi:hypothetical protein Pmani_040149 [Petrolisthes manimaculis]|uniref:Uncharacterized protein n=2 Tax=Petrolisthes TaxID=84661 RepID=A0AAE1TKL3_9EUCA|nr:hypothetical protein Pmani_040149 [Petrolisthes manimaculis]